MIRALQTFGKTKIYQNPEIVHTIEFEEGNVSTLITEHLAVFY